MRGGGFQASGSLIYDREKGLIHFLDIPTTAENPMCFEECYLPRAYKQCGSQNRNKMLSY
jgi:hypothetical protein